MNREEFYHLLRASSSIIEDERAQHGIDTVRSPARILVLGSQSILGSMHEEYLPEETTYSTEIDLAVMPTREDVLSFDNPAEEFADLIDASIGEDTAFQDAFDVYAQGVEEHTAVLPDGWQSRLIEVHATEHQIRSVVLCLDPYDLCAAKLARLAPNDRSYISSLIDSGDISVNILANRLNEVRDPRMSDGIRVQAKDFLDAFDTKTINASAKIAPESVKAAFRSRLDAATPDVTSKQASTTENKNKASRPRHSL